MSGHESFPSAPFFRLDDYFMPMNVLESIIRDALFDNNQVALANNIRAAALTGLSETNPQQASQLFFNLQLGDFSYSNTSKIAEIIFRNWAKQDSSQTWKELSTSSLGNWNSSDAIRGLITGCTDPNLRQEILQWIADHLPPPREDPSQSADAAISRNSIDAILNNPNRFDHEALITSAALGMAEHDPENAWAWLNSHSQNLFEEIPVIAKLFLKSSTVKFISGLVCPTARPPHCVRS